MTKLYSLNEIVFLFGVGAVFHHKGTPQYRDIIVKIDDDNVYTNYAYDSQKFQEGEPTVIDEISDEDYLNWSLMYWNHRREFIVTSHSHDIERKQ